MKVMIRYRVRPDRVDEHLGLVAAAFEEMAVLRPPRLRYTAHRLNDGLTFVNLVEGDDLPSPLPDLGAFQRYRAELDERCDEPPVMTELIEIESYPTAITSCGDDTEETAMRTTASGAGCIADGWAAERTA